MFNINSRLQMHVSGFRGFSYVRARQLLVTFDSAALVTGASAGVSFFAMLGEAPGDASGVLPNLDVSSLIL